MTAEDLKWRAQDLQAAYINAYHEPEKLAVLMEAMRDLWNEAVDELWEEINSLIKQGPLQGAGWDESAQRNGLILATNAIRAKRLPDSDGI